MASGLFRVTGPRDLELGADDRVEGVTVDIQVVSPLDPLLQGFTGGKASGLPERLCHGGQHVRNERQELAGRHVQRQQGIQAARCIDGEPVTDSMAMDTQELGHILARVGLTAGQEIEHLEAWLLASIVFAS
jgi:hypothetical protein